jgi:cellular nucleic acid-binding protein
MEENLFIYILRLESNKYYIGKTKDLFVRFDAHRNGTASTWTKKYKPLFVERVIERASIFDEDKYTKEYMNKYGIDNVRGGAYVMEILPEEQINLLLREITFANDFARDVE